MALITQLPVKHSSNPNVYISLIDGKVYSKAYDTPDPTYVAVWKEVVRYVNWSV